ncbi:MAG: sulfur transferase domain-containing protein [Bryobacteraceae bacterium]|jgi:uncharacterized protein (TIGR01244 family)
MKRIVSSLAAAIAMVSVAAAQSQVRKPAVEGITNFAQVESTVACAGALKPGSVAAIAKMGFASIVNLRLASEPGANVDAEEAAAKAAGIRFVHLPFDGAAPDAAVVDRFLKTIVEPGCQPAFIHCSGGNRAAMMWFIKRVLIDKWDNDRAMDEAAQLGLISPALKTFALDYIRAHKK